LDEVRTLSQEGYKEITLLGQNVNSYNDTSKLDEQPRPGLNPDGTPILSKGFKTIYKLPKGGVRFTELVDRISQIDPEMRIRFTSPHPKDFPDDLLELIRDRPNVCNYIHLPAQSGSNTVLERMRRGYTKEAYLELVDKIRATIPGVTLSSDFIAGFCEETEEEHQDTLALLDAVQFEHAFMFAYSLREKTHAHRTYKDDVPEEVKQRRLNEIIETFRKYMLQKNRQEIGKTHLVLIDGPSRKASQDYVGRTDTNKKVILPEAASQSDLQPGDYVAVRVTDMQGQTLFGEVLEKTTLVDYNRAMRFFMQ
jgi:MiaB/RimO family radical SAM methylthiotransferase